ncbi:MAG: hypothetical protein ABS69_08490 [Nitrosomonadales bacterium SCN 54-20]|nr:MAG: hypothetical protein ABS69_08490 [Nitrosomonadales bacterium SCN 54-20]
MNARARKVRKTMPDKIECMNPIGACTDGTMAAHGKGGIYRVNLRHDVSRLRSGHRRAEGVIFHDVADNFGGYVWRIGSMI